MKKYLLLIVIFFGGFNLIAVELLYPRITSIWFGNVLEIWAINFAMSLFVSAIGYKIGATILKKRYFNKYILIYLFAFTFLYYLFIAANFKAILESLLHFNEIISMLIFSLLFLFPSIGVFSMISPLFVHHFQTVLSPSSIFFTSTIGGAFSVLFVGIFAIPNLGIQFSFTILEIIIVFNIVLLTYLLRVNE